MLSVEEAQAKIAELFAPVGTEMLGLADAGGRVLRTNMIADRAQPPFAASAMDGYAVRFEDVKAGARLTVIGEIAAGHSRSFSIGAGQAARIFTGAPLPDGADHILIQEDAERSDDEITVRDSFEQKHYVRPAGCDFDEGFVLSGPRRLGSADLSLAAAMNKPVIEVSRRPVVAVIATGDELVWPGETPRDDQIVASNNFGLKAMFEADGAEVRLLPIARDNKTALRTSLELAQEADLIVTLGGASVGDHDLVQDVAKDQGLDLSFYKLAMRPGKPLMAGKLNGIPMIGLPGNPVSSLVCAHVFVRPAISALLGLGYQTHQNQTARLACDIGPNGPRTHYMRAHVEHGESGWECTPFERQDSSLLTVLSSANALMIRDANDPARRIGDPVTFTLL